VTLLVGINYDPATQVSKATTAALAMTALDTTNLRATFLAPASGAVMVRLGGVLMGATTFPQILLGIMAGSTVVRRRAPMVTALGSLATTNAPAETLFTVNGLTPGASTVWDAAYGVELGVSGTGLRYGGPNDTTASNAVGAFVFEVWTA
jgi:hypothetical protein